MSEKIYIPPIKIQGIKTKLVPFIKQNVILNSDTVWIEPFMGSGVVGFNTAPNKAVFADINPCIIDFYNAVKSKTITSNIVKEFLECEGKKLSEKDDEYYYEVRERFNKNKNPLDFLFLNRSCFNGMIRFNKKNCFNVPYGHKPQRFAKAYITKITNQVRYIEEQLMYKDWTFQCQPFQKTLENADKDSFIYCDPPYIGRHVDYYDNWEECDELLLKEHLLSSDTKFMLSTWDHNQYRTNEYIDHIWSFCHKINIEHFYHVGAKKANRNPMTEALLTNYSLPTHKKITNDSPTNEQISFFSTDLAINL